jgi:hypothetical protein
MTDNSKQVTGWYGNAFKNWPKQCGPKPGADLLTTVHALGCRPGKQALARALELRECGATDGQVKMACIAGWGASGSHHNKRRDLITGGYVKRVPMQASDEGHQVYRITLTARGEGRVKTVLAGDADKASTGDAPKAKAGKKAKRTPKAKAVDKVIADAGTAMQAIATAPADLTPADLADTVQAADQPQA